MQYIGIKDKKRHRNLRRVDYLVDRYPVDDENLDAGYHESLLPVVWCENKLQWCVDASFAKDGYLVGNWAFWKALPWKVKGKYLRNKK